MNKYKQKQLLSEIMNEDAKDGLYKQQTAVEWLAKEFCKNGIDIGSGYKVAYEIPKELLEQAKAMEKEQIIKAACYEPFLGDFPRKEGEHYYNKTYIK